MADAGPTLNLGYAARVITLANSPNYVFNRLKSDMSVRSIAVRYTTAEIMSWLGEKLQSAPTSVEELASRYIYLLALSYKNAHEVFPALDSIPNRHLEWGQELKAMIRAAFTQTNSATAQVQPKLLVASVAPTSANAANNQVAPRIILPGD